MAGFKKTLWLIQETEILLSICAVSGSLPAQQGNHSPVLLKNRQLVGSSGTVRRALISRVYNIFVPSLPC